MNHPINSKNVKTHTAQKINDNKHIKILSTLLDIRKMLIKPKVIPVYIH